MEKKSDAEKARLQMKKKTAEELAELANKKTESTDSIDEPVPVAQRPSESSLNQLNAELKKVPMVKAFNSAERQAAATAKK